MAATYSYGSAPTYTKIASYTATTSTASYTFSNIPQGYTDLVLVTSGSGSASANLECYINGDTGNNYSFTYLFGNNSAGSGRESSVNRIVVGSLISGASYGIANFQNYSSNSVNKSVLVRVGRNVELVMGIINTWRNTSPITSLQIFGFGGATMSSGYTANLYGIKAASVPKAEGGDISTDGTYWYHQFRNTSAFSTKTDITADVLTVAGGGGGGSYRGGGGGAGGLVYSASQSLSGRYVVTVGAGGFAGIGNIGFAAGLPGGKGGNSRFGALTEAIGGGRGPAAVGGTNGEGAGTGNGGSGCGVSSASQTPGLGTSGQGNNGGAGWSGYSGKYGAGGGGGAGAVGSAGTSTAGGAGGAGLLYFGQYYAGGGGGGNYGGGTSGAGGSSIGGAGGSNSNGGAGSISTGSGGGGAGSVDDSTTNNGGTGGSGIVIVRYAV